MKSDLSHIATGWQRLSIGMHLLFGWNSGQLQLMKGMIVYIDESGDLRQQGSSHFVITAVVTDRSRERRIGQAVRRTLREKVNRHSRTGRNELKGSLTTHGVRRYWWRLIKSVEFSIVSVIIDKRAWIPQDPKLAYQQILAVVIDELPLALANGDLVINIDQSRRGQAMIRLGHLVRIQVEARVSEGTTVFVNSLPSEQSPGLQMADLLSWGIFRKHVANDRDWYDIYQHCIRTERCVKLT